MLGRVLHGINPTTIALVFLLGVLGISTFWGLRQAVFMAVIATLAFNYFFLPPVGTFTIAEPQNWVALFAFLITAVTASELSGAFPVNSWSIAPVIGMCVDPPTSNTRPSISFTMESPTRGCCIG